MNSSQSVICPGCGAQCAAAVATAHGWSKDACPHCPPAPDPDRPHPLAVAFAWWPDYPEVQPEARRVYTATCGCGWSAAAGSERHAWYAAWEHAGVLDAWSCRSVIERPAPTPGRGTAGACAGNSKPPGCPTSQCAPSWPATTMAAVAVGIPAGVSCRPAPTPAELCACPCHGETEEEPDPCRHSGATIGHLGRCPTWGRSRVARPAPADQPTLF